MSIANKNGRLSTIKISRGVEWKELRTRIYSVNKDVSTCLWLKGFCGLDNLP